MPAVCCSPGSHAPATDRHAWRVRGRACVCVWQVDALVEAMRPLVEGAGLQPEREGAQLAAQLRQLLGQLEGSTAASSSGGSGGDSAQQGSSEAASPSDALKSLCGGAQPEALSRAFNQLEFAQRRVLLQLVPEARVQLNVRGVDLK
jgi:hypothetical protein